jgi:hypothetical protein
MVPIKASESLRVVMPRDSLEKSEGSKVWKKAARKAISSKRTRKSFAKKHSPERHIPRKY